MKLAKFFAPTRPNLTLPRYRWTVVKILRDQGEMKSVTIRFCHTKWGARSAMHYHYQLQKSNFQIGWSLTRALKQADRCELIYSKNSGKLAQVEFLVRRDRP